MNAGGKLIYYFNRKSTMNKKSKKSNKQVKNGEALDTANIIIWIILILVIVVFGGFLIELGTVLIGDRQRLI